jgi:PPP family 3-phenylpropionic acid transporter
MSRLAPAAAVSLFYGAWFATLGVYLPYFNLYLDRLGLDSAQIGIVNAILPLCGALVPALLGHLSDHLGRRRSLVVASSLLGLLTFLPMFRVAGFPGAAAVMAICAAARAPALPLVEASALEIVERGGPAYGRMRVWGSGAFILTALAAGPLVGRLGEGVVLILITMLLMVGVAAALHLPPDSAPSRESRAGGGVGQALRRRSVTLFLLGGVLMQASHGPYYVFFSLHLRQAGVPPRTLGLLWAAAIGGEILMMLRMLPILMRHGPVPIMTGCSALAAVRWTLCALSVEPLILLPAQVLHAATFAAFHVAAVGHTFDEFGRARSATGQAIYSSATYGLGSILGMVGSGLLRDLIGTPALFLVASATAAAGGLLMAAVPARR